MVLDFNFGSIMRTKKILKYNTRFSTKDDACIAVTGNKMSNRFRMEEVTDKWNIIFIMRGEAYYKQKGEKVKTGTNKVFANRIESFRQNRKGGFRLDMRKPCLVFLKDMQKNNPALTYYDFYGVFKISCVCSTSEGELDFTALDRVSEDATL